MKYSKELIEICNTKSGNQIAKNKNLLNLLNTETNFLSLDSTTSNRIGYVILNKYEIQFCDICMETEVVYDRSKNEFKTCSRSCGGKKARLTMNKINTETGISNNDTGVLKRLHTMSQIDPETGLSIKILTENKRQKTMSQIDPETGLRRSQLAGLKTSKSLNQPNPITGISPAKAKEFQRNLTLSNVDPKTGLTGHQVARNAQWETMSQIDPITGNIKYIESRSKQTKTMSQINPETGLSGIDVMIDKIKTSKNKIDPETGLSGYQIGEINRQKTMSQIDTETGLTHNKLKSIKSQKTMNYINSYGWSIRDQTILKIKNTYNTAGFNNISNCLPINYKLLTTKSEYTNSKLLKYSCDKCGSIRESYWPYIRCLTCYPYNKSLGEHEVLKFCQSLASNVESNNRQIIPPLELDIYLPDHNLAIEYNGIYWHSSNSTDSENRDYHLTKTKLCHEKGIQLFHIFENEWSDPQKQNIWKSIIRNRLGQSSRIYARKTTVKPVTSGDKSQFLDENHLQGNCQSSVNLGLYHKDELVSIMTFGKSRYDKKIDWELIRFCNKIEYSVIGGAGKLLKAFRRENDGSVISYADKRRSVGNLYEKLGFRLSHESGPNYFYVKNGKLESRIKYQKHKLEAQLEIYDSELTESENMYNNGYRKIYDCGNQVWLLC